METTKHSKIFSWIGEICSGKGTVKLQQRLRRLRLERPELSIFEILDLLKPSVSADQGQKCVEQLDQLNIRHVTIFDEDYPQLLAECSDPPIALFYSGNLKTLHRPCVSIIGARACTTYGIQTTRLIAGELARFGFTVVSGLALGIDAIAHEAALQVNGATASVLGSGIKVIYPKQHIQLARDIVRHKGIVLTEFPPQEPPKPYHFPMRNRIISALSHATIVIEAEKKSGTLITAQFCLEQGRELFAVPGPLNRPTSEGTHSLISKGEAHIFTSVADFLSHFKNLINGAISLEKQLKIEINDPIMRKIYDSLDPFESTCFDSLLAEMGQSLEISPGQLGAKLTQMETKGLITALPGQTYLRTSLLNPGEKPE